MCRMLGVVGDNPSKLLECLEAFYPLCARGLVKSTMTPGHRDGWGIAGYTNGQAKYFARRPYDASEEPEAWRKAALEIQFHPTPIVLAHFRKGSIGNRSLENTHPFNKNGWLFCHNGTVYEHQNLFLEKYIPEGQTDSERLFLFLLEAVERYADARTGLNQALWQLRRHHEYNSLTFLLTNGKSLYAFRGYSGERLQKGETNQERDRYYTLWTADQQGTQVVCSEPILKENWKKIANGKLAIIHPGKAIETERIF